MLEKLLKALAIRETEDAPRIAQLKQHIAEAQAELRALEHAHENLRSQIKDLVLEQYASDGNRQVHEYVTIKHVTRTKYDEASALAYCQKYRPDLLKTTLKKREFNLIVGREYNGSDVEVVRDVEVSISRKLGALAWGQD